MSTAPLPKLGRKSFYTRITASVPLLVTVIVHVVLIAVAGFFVVSEQILGKKKSFEAANASESVVQKKVEHRLQVARKGGGSASSSPVSANRIFTTSESALQLPPMPELPTLGASALAGMGFGKGAGGVGSGTGYGTGTGTGNSLGSGFMSMSFLGTTSQRASKIVFVVDVGAGLLDIRKGGFEAFSIIREEMMKLVSRLPPSAEFSVVLYELDGRDRGVNTSLVNPFAINLLPATSTNKTRFFEWMKPVNRTPEIVGLKSVEIRTPWRAKPLPNAGLDEDFRSPTWVTALRCALEMGPDTIYLVAGSVGDPVNMMKDQELAKKKKLHDETNAALVRSGLTIEGVEAARNAFRDKVFAELAVVNAKLKEKGQTPFVVAEWQRIFQPDFQAALKQKGFSIKLDTTGWADKEGKPLWGTGFVPWSKAEYSEVLTEISKLQRALLKDNAALNVFLLVGPTEQPKEAIENLGKTSSRNGGKFQLLTNKKLKELSARDEAAK
jgi:hypothetical protein